MKTLLVYLLIVNAIGFALMLTDKLCAIRNEWRIPEATLMLWAICGGSFGVFAGMRLFHHKTRKPKFSVGVPVILIVQIGLSLLMRRVLG